MRVAIALSPNGYLPEAHAYRRFLGDLGVDARLVDSPREIKRKEIAILFTGNAFLDRSIECARRVHEIHSLSGGSLPWLRDWGKWHLAARADGYIFLDGLPYERHAGRVDPACPVMRRPMGIDRALFDCARGGSGTARHDLVYCGSLHRPGIADSFARLGRAGFTILAIGRVPPALDRAALERVGVTFAGFRPRDELPDLIASARAGLNITPDVFPFNRQDSTKTLEYVAAGLPVVSNRYAWIEQFAAAHALDIGWLDEIECPADLDRLATPEADLSARSWSAILEDRGLLPFLERVAR